MPNDEHEQDRLDMQHLIYRLALDSKLFLAPIPQEKLLDVLDVGCGTGMWAIDVADENPLAQVLGIDLRCVFELSMITITDDSLQSDSTRSVSIKLRIKRWRAQPRLTVDTAFLPTANF